MASEYLEPIHTHVSVVINSDLVTLRKDEKKLMWLQKYVRRGSILMKNGSLVWRFKKKIIMEVSKLYIRCQFDG
jgi:hypothetical protein